MQPSYQQAAPQQAQVLQFPQQTATVAPYQQQASTPSQSSQDNPYKEAFNRMVGMLSQPLSMPSIFQQQGQQSAQVQQQQSYPAANYPQQQGYQQGYQQTSPYQQHSQAAYGNNYSQQSQQQLSQNAASGSSASTAELNQVLGPDAAAILNESHCQLEDSLTELKNKHTQLQHLYQVQGQHLRAAEQTINALAPHIQNYVSLERTVDQLTPHIERYNQMENLLTDPNSLAAYTVDFFTHVHPVQSVREQQQMQMRPSFPDMPASQAGSGQVQLGEIAPWERYKVSDAMERQGMFKQKVIVGQ
jgi:hypothetical protein